MNQDLEKLLQLRASMSYLYGLRQKKKREMDEISKHTNFQYQYIYDAESKYRENRKVKPEYKEDKEELDCLEKKKHGFVSFGTYTDHFYYTRIGDFNWAFYLPLILGGIIGIILFFIFKEQWLHISTWASTVTFTIIFHAFALLIFAATFAIGLFVALLAIFFISWLALLPVWFYRAKKIERLKYRVYGFLHTKDPFVFNQKDKETLDEKVAYYKRIISDDEQKMQKCIDELYYADKQFNSTSFIIRKEDYQYLDYLIYLIASNRAGDIHQAFQLLEAQLRHNELMGKLDSLQQSITSSLKSLEKAIEDNTAAIQSLEQTVATQSENIRYLIQEGNKISSMQLAKLESLQKEFAEFKRQYPRLRYYY